MADRFPPILPGATQLAVMLRSANSTAMDFVSPISPAFPAATCARRLALASQAPTSSGSALA